MVAAYDFAAEPVYPVDPLDVELVRAAVRRLRAASTLGQVADDFARYSASANFSGAWNEIQRQLTAEGADVGAINQAQDQFTQAYHDLGAAAQALKDDEVATAAKSLVLSGKTIAGAVNLVSGLLSSSNVEAAQAALQGFTATMIALTGAAGFTGVGAAIAGGIGLVADVLKQAGLFGGAPPAAGTICGFPFNTKPDWQVGCLGAWGDPISPGTAYWRTFPKTGVSTQTLINFAKGIYAGAAAGGDPDAPWFVPGQVGPGDWKGAFYGIRAPGADQSYSGVPNPPSTDWRPIDNAFGSYGNIGPLEQHITTSAPELAGVVAAFVSAWYGNAEYALNGWQPRPDPEVLAHTVRLWNASHEPNPTKVLTPTDGIDGWLDSLVLGILHTTTAKDIVTNSGLGVKVHGGALKHPPIAPSTGGAGASAATVALASVAAVGVAGGGLWLLLGQPLTMTAFRAAIDHFVRRVFG